MASASASPQANYAAGQLPIEQQQRGRPDSTELFVPARDPSQEYRNRSLKRESMEKEDSNDDGKGDAAPSEKKKASIGDYFRVFKYTDTLDRSLYAASIVCGIANGAALPLMTLVFGSSTSTIVNFASGSGDDQAFSSNIHTLVLYFIYIFAARFVIVYFGTLGAGIASARTTNRLRKAFMQAVLRQDIAHFDLQDNGSVANQVLTNANAVSQGISEKLFTCVTGISLFFSAFVVALAVQWKLALITMSIVPGMVLVVGASIGLLTPVENEILRLYSQGAAVAQDALASFKTIVAFGAQQKVLDQYDEYLTAAHSQGKKKSPVLGFLFSSNTFFTFCGTSLAFWEGHRLYQSGEIPNVGTVITVILSVVLGATSVLFFLPQIEVIANAASAASQLFTIIDKPSLIDPFHHTGKRPATCTGQIEICNLSFAYPARPTAQILHGLNLSIPAGKTTALVGPSGCGKSSIVALLERWYQPTGGHITLDGTDIAELDANWLRSHLRLIQQEPTLFQGTVAENVAKGFVPEQEALTEDEKMRLIQEACEAANAHEFIQMLPNMYHTELGEAARMLSGGQRQRIAIARSIISNPKILLCDEATSSLDPRAEKAVQQALDQVSANKTTLVIAHKLSTIMGADSIVMISDGQIVEQGTHQELLKREGLYAAMVRAQDLNSSDQGPDFNEASKEQLHYDDQSVAHPPDQLSLTRNDTDLEKAQSQSAQESLTAGTLNCSLIVCIWTLLKESKDLYPWYLLISASYLALAGTYPAQALLFSRSINVFTLSGSNASNQADFYALMFFVVALGNLVGYFFVGLCCNVISQTLTYRHRKELLQRMLSMDQDFFDQPENSSGALTGRLSSVPAATQELMSQNLGLMLNVVFNVIATSALGIAYKWKLGLTLVATGITLIVGSGYMRVRLDQRLEAMTEKQFSASASLAVEAVSSIRTVSLLTLEKNILSEYGQCLDDIVSSVVRNLVVVLIPYAFSQSAEFLVMALGFWYGSQLLLSGEYSSTQFFVVFIAIVFGDQGAAQFFTWTTSITKAKGSTNYMLWFRTLSSSIKSTADKEKGPPGNDAALGLEAVEFRYRQRQTAQVLNGMSLDIRPGSFAAFVGPSGCGKSTIVSLTQRFYDPTKGCITMNNEDVKSFSPGLYRQEMSLVQQEPPLYFGSVRSNITLGLGYEPSDEELKEACQQANILDFVSSLPEGLDTPCGSKGMQFSGGQRQRIAIARALIRKPRLLLLDEATSALDTQSEKLVQKALEDAMTTGNRTTIAVAHRLSTTRDADIIFVIEDGRIAESGTHEELQLLRGRYYAMCLAQSLDQAV